MINAATGNLNQQKVESQHNNRMKVSSRRDYGYTG